MKIKSYFKICLIAAILTFLALFARKQTDTFTLSAIASHGSYNSDLDFSLSDRERAELQKAFNQPYTYWQRGGQVYVFLSEDGHYVIKFLKQRLFRKSYLLNHIPLPFFLHRYRDKRNAKREDKRARDVFSYSMAFKDMKNETGLLYVHLTPTQHLKRTLRIVDRLHISHDIDLDQFEFLVQKRAIPVYDHLTELMNQNQKEKAQVAIQNLFNMIDTTLKKGYKDRDPILKSNCGFIKEIPIKIDVGRFIKDRPSTEQELKKALDPLEVWIKSHYPELLSDYLILKDQFFHETISI